MPRGVCDRLSQLEQCLVGKVAGRIPPLLSTNVVRTEAYVAGSQARITCVAKHHFEHPSPAGESAGHSSRSGAYTQKYKAISRKSHRSFELVEKKSC